MKRSEIKVGMTLALVRNARSGYLFDRRPQKVVVVDLTVPGKYNWSEPSKMKVRVRYPEHKMKPDASVAVLISNLFPDFDKLAKEYNAQCEAHAKATEVGEQREAAAETRMANLLQRCADVFDGSLDSSGHVCEKLPPHPEFGEQRGLTMVSAQRGNTRVEVAVETMENILDAYEVLKDLTLAASESWPDSECVKRAQEVLAKR